MLDFPDAPNDGDQSTQPNGITYQWDATLTRWTSVISLGAGIVAGTVVQEQSFETGAVATGTTLTPNDDTIPQITEGDEYMSLVFTPKYATSLLRIDIVVSLAHSTITSPSFVTALHRDSIADALAAVAERESSSTGNIPKVIGFTHWTTADAITATTFQVRCGASIAGTLTFNGVGGARKLGGVLASSITVTEIQPDAVTVSGSNDFDDKLGGYNSDGTLDQFMGDLDTIVDNSTYWFTPDTVTNEPSDIPPGASGTGFTINTLALTVNSAIQICIGRSTGTEYQQWQRNKSGGAWDAWVRIVDGKIEPFRESNCWCLMNADGTLNGGSPNGPDGTSRTLSTVKRSTGVYEVTFNPPYTRVPQAISVTNYTVEGVPRASAVGLRNVNGFEIYTFTMAGSISDAACLISVVNNGD